MAPTYQGSRALAQRARETIPVGAHTYANDDVDKTVEATRGVLEVYKRGLHNGVKAALEGRTARPVDRRRG